MKNTIIAGLAIVAAVIVSLLFTSSTPRQLVGSIQDANNLSRATTTNSFFVTTSTRVLATTTNALDPSNSYDRVYATICTASSNPVYLALNNDKTAATSSVTAIIAAAAGYNACYEITNRNHYTGSVQASSTNQTSTLVTVSDYVQ